MLSRLIVVVFSSLGLLVTFLMSVSASPEKLLIGTWSEERWSYEKLNGNHSANMENQLITDYVKDKLGQDLIIHQAETWQFLPNGVLILYKDNKELRTLRWRLKGRGHILKLQYSDNTVEHYDLSVEKNVMTLQFDIDMQVRGIVKLTFERQQKG